ALPACLFYRGYSKTVCISPNHVVCHGIPGPKALKDGDIVNIDVTVIVDGWHGDTSRMYPIGDVAPRARRLIDVTYEAMDRGMKAVKPGARLGDIGWAIQSYVESMRCSVVRDFCGHGLGQVFHDNPNILHFGRKGEGEVLMPGMFFTIEPMVNLGKPQVKLLADGAPPLHGVDHGRSRFVSRLGLRCRGFARHGCGHIGNADVHALQGFQGHALHL
ncbi:MAG: type I methionyl aminopeptidase, partial [Betaproteobacteria bacterium]|nr:type I methionyl aminopeptidase [Betaproteobacteria bacterium]